MRIPSTTDAVSSAHASNPLDRGDVPEHCRCSSRTHLFRRQLVAAPGSIRDGSAVGTGARAWPRRSDRRSRCRARHARCTLSSALRRATPRGRSPWHPRHRTSIVRRCSYRWPDRSDGGPGLPSRSQLRRSVLLVARPPSTSATRVTGSPVNGSSTSTYQQSPSSGVPTTRRSPPRLTSAAACAGREQLFGHDVGGEALPDTARVDADALGQPHQTGLSPTP